MGIHRYVRGSKTDYPFMIEKLSDNTIVLSSCSQREMLDYNETVQILNELFLQFKIIEPEEFNQKIVEAKINTYIDSFFSYLSSTPYPHYPVEDLKLRRKRKKGRVWSFNCGCCGKKITLEEGDRYYTMTPYLGSVLFQTDNNDNTERACSKDCMRVIAKEIATQNVKKEYIEEFDLPNVINDIDGYINQL